ncbi:MAG: MFS transporter [Haloferacaceae archaeon]
MSDPATDSPTEGSVSYAQLLTDLSLLSVFAISATAALGMNAVPVGLPGVGETFGLSETEIGLVMSAFTLAVMGTMPVISVLADVYGRRPVVIPSLLLLGASGLAALAVTSYPLLLGLRFVQGVGFAGTLPLTTTLTGDLYTGAEGSAAQGIRSGFNGLASALAPVVAGFLAAFAWQYAFAVFALGLPVAVMVYWFYPEPVAEAGTERRLVSELRSYWGNIRAAVDRTLVLLYGGGLTLFFLKAGLLTFVPVFVVDGLGGAVTSAGTVLGVYGGTRVVVSPLAGVIVGRLGRKAAVLLGTAVAAVGTAAVPFASTLPLLAVAVGTFAVGESVLNPVVNDAVAAVAADDQRAGIMSGLQICKNVGLTVAPALMGAIIAASGFTGAFLTATAVCVAFGAVFAVGFQPVDGAFEAA